MLGVTLLFVGIVLINNGACQLLKVDKKSTAALNVIVGFLLTFINFVAIYKGVIMRQALGCYLPSPIFLSPRTIFST